MYSTPHLQDAQAVGAGSPSLDWLPRAATAILAALTVAGVAQFFYQLGAKSLWLDELWTAAATDPTISLRVWLSEWVLPDVHPPFYLFLMRIWRLMVDANEFGLRLFSAVLATATVAAVLAMQRWEPVVRQPLALAAWFAGSVGVTHYAQDARMYALLLLLTTVATLLAVAIGRRMDRRESVTGPTVALAATLIAAEYTHYFGALAASGLFGALLLFTLCWHRRQLPLIAAAGFATIAAFLPWLVVHVSYIAEKSGGRFWITNNWETTFPLTATFAGGTTEVCAVIAAAVAGCLALYPRRLWDPACFIPLLAMGLMLLGAIVVSLHTPVITSRNLLILLPPFYLLTIAVLIGFLEDRGWAGRIAAAIVPILIAATSFGYASHRMVTEQNDQWRITALRVASLPGCDGADLQVNFWPEEIYAYYLPPSYRDALRRVMVNPYKGATAPVIEPPGGTCPLILWSGHMAGDHLVRKVLKRLEMERSEIIMWETKGNVLILDKERLTAAAEPDGPASTFLNQQSWLRSRRAGRLKPGSPGDAETRGRRRPASGALAEPGRPRSTRLRVFPSLTGAGRCTKQWPLAEHRIRRCAKQAGSGPRASRSADETRR